jgi:hypothetical protein
MHKISINRQQSQENDVYIDIEYVNLSNFLNEWTANAYFSS